MMHLTVGQVEVLVQRSSRQRPCIQGAPEYDRKIIEYIMKKVGCKPPYWNSTSTLDPCSQKKQHHKILEEISTAVYNGNAKRSFTVENPCRSLERISYDAIDVDTPQSWMQKSSWLNESVGVVLDFKEWTYKEVKSVRGMDIQALIGKFTMHQG